MFASMSSAQAACMRIKTRGLSPVTPQKRCLGEWRIPPIFKEPLFSLRRMLRPISRAQTCLSTAATRPCDALASQLLEETCDESSDEPAIRYVAQVVSEVHRGRYRSGRNAGSCPG